MLWVLRDLVDFKVLLVPLDLLEHLASRESWEVLVLLGRSDQWDRVAHEGLTE